MSRVLFVFFLSHPFLSPFLCSTCTCISESSSLGCRSAFLTLFKTRVWFGWEGGVNTN